MTNQKSEVVELGDNFALVMVSPGRSPDNCEYCRVRSMHVATHGQSVREIQILARKQHGHLLVDGLDRMGVQTLGKLLDSIAQCNQPPKRKANVLIGLMNREDLLTFTGLPVEVKEELVLGEFMRRVHLYHLLLIAGDGI